MTNTDLIARLERADEMTVELFRIASDECPPVVSVADFREWSKKFQRLIEAEAWTDAALLLVPEGNYAHILFKADGSGLAAIGKLATSDPTDTGTISAATPALALLIAILRTKEVA